ncbi:MAG TPA: ScpA family protein [Candidatus Paceibacterota bacterium]
MIFFVTSTFAIKIPQFEGPLELLLDLIEERKLLISDISLSQVAEDFLAYIETRETFPMGQAAHFVLVAATLLLIKSRALLPLLSLSDEEEGDVKDLEFRLSVYQVFRNIARKLSALSGRMFFGNGVSRGEPLFAPSPDLSAASLAEAARRALSAAPQITFAPTVKVARVITLEEMITHLSERIEKAIQMTFRDFSRGRNAGTEETVVSFLAMLELVKRGLLMVKQEGIFEEITMSYNGEIRAPKY